jgi:aminoglycoside 2''-phosphotransferase
MDIKYIDRIKQVYPDLSIENCEPNDIGQNNDVLIINKSLVFRFPKYKKGIINLKKETAILESIKNIITTPIPYPIYKSFNQMEVGEVFTGYKLIQGSPLWEKDFKKIEDEGLLKRLASQLVTFLIELHSTPTEQLVEVLQQERKDGHKVVAELYKKIDNKLYPFMRKNAQEEVSHMFEAFLKNERHLNFKQTLIHGDFGASNILWEPNFCLISGVIDFGGSGLGDPAYDFAGILSSYGETFFNMCINLYPNGKEISERIKFYKSTFALQEALHGIENNDIQAFENGIKDYR